MHVLKAKFHYASWFGACSELVRSWFKAKFHYAIWIEPASNQRRISSEPAPNWFGAGSEPARVMEFGFKGLVDHGCIQLL